MKYVIVLLLAAAVFSSCKRCYQCETWIHTTNPYTREATVTEGNYEFCGTKSDMEQHERGNNWSGGNSQRYTECK